MRSAGANGGPGRAPCWRHGPRAGAPERAASSQLAQSSAVERLQSGLVRSSPHTPANGVQARAPAPLSVRERSGISVAERRASFLRAEERVTATQRRSSQALVVAGGFPGAAPSAVSGRNLGPSDHVGRVGFGAQQSIAPSGQGKQFTAQPKFTLAGLSCHLCFQPAVTPRRETGRGWCRG